MRYIIMRTDLERSIEIHSDPLPHIEIGNTLIFVNEHLGGEPLQIENVETTISAVKAPSARIVVTTIYVRARE